MYILKWLIDLAVWIINFAFFFKRLFLNQLNEA